MYFLGAHLNEKEVFFFLICGNYFLPVPVIPGNFNTFCLFLIAHLALVQLHADGDTPPSKVFKGA